MVADIKAELEAHEATLQAAKDEGDFERLDEQMKVIRQVQDKLETARIQAADAQAAAKEWKTTFKTLKSNAVQVCGSCCLLHGLHSSKLVFVCVLV